MLSFEIDRKTGEITKAPLIALNELKDETDRNEQEGIRYMLMGFFLGPRNIYQHNYVGSGPTNAISILTQASFFLDLLDGKSIKDGGTWITEYVSYSEIFEKMPKKIDQWKLKRILKKKHRKKNSSADDDLW